MTKNSSSHSTWDDVDLVQETVSYHDLAQLRRQLIQIGKHIEDIMDLPPEKRAILTAKERQRLIKEVK